MSLPLRCTRANMIRICSAVLCAVVIALAMPNAASAWHGDEWHPHHYHWRHGWGPRFFVPPPVGVALYPGYYPAPVYSPPYYAGPSSYFSITPLSFSYGFGFRR
jgi:hypothetical protein